MAMLRCRCGLGLAAGAGKRLRSARFAFEKAEGRGRPSLRRSIRLCRSVEGMGEWARYAIPAAAALIAFVPLLATLAYRWLIGHQRDFQLLLERIDKEAAERERAIQAALERSDRTFATLMARHNELAKELAGIAQRTARSEGTLEAMTAGGRRAASKPSHAADEPRTVAAQQLPGESPAE